MSIKKINTIDLFAGCGGLLEGFEMSNKYKTLACVEWDLAANENLRNHLKEKWNYRDAEDRVLHFDIQRFDELFNGWDDKTYGKSNGLNSLIGNEKVDLIIGGPPCQSYSIAGRVRDEKGMKDDYRNFLFESYIEVVKKYKPKAFVFENVPGILSAKPGGEYIINTIKKTFSDSGYTILNDLSNAIVNFTEYGVPQNRKRIIILGLSNEHYREKAISLLNDFYTNILPSYKVSIFSTVRKAIGDLPKLFPLEIDHKFNGKKFSHSISKSHIENHLPRWHNQRDINIFKVLTKDIENKDYKYVSTKALKTLYTQQTGKLSNIHKYYVLRWDEPSNLIPAHIYKDGLRHIHPDSKQSRSITVREAARLQGFPDDYIFIGSQAEQYKMIGNAVPPIFSKILAESIYKLLFLEV